MYPYCGTPTYSINTLKHLNFYGSKRCKHETLYMEIIITQVLPVLKLRPWSVWDVMRVLLFGNEEGRWIKG